MNIPLLIHSSHSYLPIAILVLQPLNDSLYEQVGV